MCTTYDLQWLIHTYIDNTNTQAICIGMLIDFEYLTNYHTRQWRSKRTKIFNFKTRHGDSAIPVSSMAEAREVEHFGKKGVVVQQALVDVLRKNKEMHIDHVRTEAGNSVKHVYSWSDLSVEEKDTYREVVGLVEKAASELNFGKVEDRLTIVDFGDAALDGLFKAGSIQVAKRLLTDYEEFLATLVHEVAHAAGGDGSVGHERAEGKLFSRIVRGLTMN
jgi:hypothetical protein